jgi:hypothetical protein
MNSIVTVRLATKGNCVCMEGALPKRSGLFFRIQYQKIFKQDYPYYFMTTMRTMHTMRTNNSECHHIETAGTFP